MANKKQINVLITSSGRRVELVQEFQRARDELNLKGRIIATDYSTLAPSLYKADEYVSVPRLDSNNYIENLIQIINEKKINLVVPTIDTELKLLAENKKYIEENTDTFAMVSSIEVIEICESKYKTYEFFINNGFLAPRVINNDDIENENYSFPLFIKPQKGSSSINTFKVNNEKELLFFKDYIKQPIIQEYADGDEYTIDVFCDFYSKPITIVPRKRLKTRSGEVLIGEITKDRSIIEEVKRMIETLKPIGHITIQCIKTKRGNEYIEINPRFGGGAPISIVAGADSPRNLLKLLLGERLEYNEDYKEVLATRYDQAVFLSKEKEISYLPFVAKQKKIKAVVFDLDDTLVLEKDFVFSGFKEVALKIYEKYKNTLLDHKGFNKNSHSVFKDYQSEEIIEEIVNVMIKLFYKDSKKVFNRVLKYFNINYDNKEIKNLVNIYRNHTPEITLSEGTKKVLDWLSENDYRLGLITDGFKETQKKKIKALEIEQYFDKIVITDELGRNFWKPSEVPYVIMREALDIDYEEMVYVGDNVSKDFITAKRLGIKTVHIDRDEGIYRNISEEFDEEYFSDYMINDLMELMSLLQL